MSTNYRVGLNSLQVGTPESPSPHRWTLFGQLMENEGQLPISPGGRRRTGARQGSSNRRDSIESGSNTSRLHSSNSDPFLDMHSVADNDGHSIARLFGTAPSFLGSANPTNDDDSDSSESDEDEDEEPSPSLSPEPSDVPWYSPQRIPSVPTLYRNVLKCAIAYFVASLFTFNPFFADILSKITAYGDISGVPGRREPFPSGHMVATIAVYYNPAKTMGGMIEADIFCLVGLLFAAFVCLCSMNMFWWLELSPGCEWLGDLVAILWIGISMSIVSWSKVWMANPSFNTACSMATIIISVVIVKEGGLSTLLQVTTIVICGSLVSNLVCYLIWPQSAIDNLQNNMTKTLDSFSTVLSMLTNTFLLEGGVHNKAHLDKMQGAVENHQTSFTSLKKSIFEARTEWFLRGDPAGALPDDTGKQAYEDAVDSLNRLGQHLNGLRSGTRLQYDLTKAGVVKSRRRKHKKHHNRPMEFELSTSEDEETAMLKAAAIMFGGLVDDLGPPLKALSGACTTSLKRLREAFEQSKSQRRKKGTLFRQDEFLGLVDGIEQALVRFESTSNHALLRWYRKGDGPPISRPRSIASLRGSVYSSRGDDLDALLVGGDNEQVFLVYLWVHVLSFILNHLKTMPSFIFTLQEFAREVVSLVDAMGRIYHYEQDCISRGRWWKHIRHPFPSFPKVQPHAPNTMQTPPSDELGAIGRFKQAVWKFGTRLTERDANYNLRQTDLSVVNVAGHRALAVTAGVLWAAFISRFWWPAEARRELSRALGEFCLNIGWLYTRLVASNSFAPEYRSEADGDEHEMTSANVTAPSQSTKLNNSIKEFMSMELHLQIKLIELQGLLAQTQHEPRLKGPFPILLYRGILTSLQTILDRLHSMRCVTTREEWYTSVRQDFIIPVNKERHEMVGNIILSLSTLASAFRLKAPLPPYLPPVEKSRQNLVDAIRRLDVVRNRDIKGSRQLLFFAYALTMKGVTDELETLGRTMQETFGVIGGSADEFEALFMYPEDSRRWLDHAV
ncbi:hypothetical protein C0991_002748 [Blastosporella zonata]|nr:hypothetical protein C0991_002748 [Blastosporella zonata]